MGKEIEPIAIVSDESGTDGRFQSVCFIAGPLRHIKALNTVTRKALAAWGTSEIKWKDIDDARRSGAAAEALPYLLDCPATRILVLSWDMQDTRRQVERRDSTADFHRMLFHGLRSIADWFGDHEFHWYHDQKTDLDEKELQAFLGNTRGHKALAEYPHNLFGDLRHRIRFNRAQQRCSKEAPLIGLADLCAGAVRHSIEHSQDCVDAWRERGGQDSLFEEVPTSASKGSRGSRAKREWVVKFRELAGARSLGVSLESTQRLATQQRGDKIWLWHYEPQGDYDKAPLKPARDADSHPGTRPDSEVVPPPI